MTVRARKITKEMKALGDKTMAEHAQRYFKTGKGEYGEGDIFLGIRVPVIRQLVKSHGDVTLPDALELLKSPLHEIRVFALLSMVSLYNRAAKAKDKRLIYSAYLANTRHINNWDLIDLTAHHIVGAYLHERDRKPLYRLARSKNMWERRISIVSTFYFMRQGEVDESFKVAEILVNDSEDLIHKATGWVLREVGKRDLVAEERFLKKHCRTMPRTMLRYAIERFPARKKSAYMSGRI